MHNVKVMSGLIFMEGLEFKSSLGCNIKPTTQLLFHQGYLVKIAGRKDIPYGQIHNYTLLSAQHHGLLTNADQPKLQQCSIHLRPFGTKVLRAVMTHVCNRSIFYLVGRPLTGRTSET